MFSVIVNDTDGFQIIRLEDSATGTFAEIFPSCGAILHAFAIQHNGNTLNVIDSYSDAADFKNNCTSKGFKGCKLSPFVCRLKEGKYSFGQTEYKIQKFYLGQNALHGLLYEAVFNVTDQQSGIEKASVTMKHEYRADDPGYPFNYDCIVRYELTEGNAFSIFTELINKDEGLIPVADGWHPYFTLGGKIDDLQLEFQSKTMLEFDEQLIPTGRSLSYEKFVSLRKIGDTFFDNCFTLNQAESQPLCILRDTVKKIQIEIQPGTAYPYLQIYTPDHRQSIAIENLSAAPDAFNNNMATLILEPGTSAAFKTTYTIRSLT